MDIELSKIKPYLYHAKFNTRYELTSTMLRFGEYYESPEFRGKAFTLGQFKKWYIKSTKKNTFTYYKDWSGYNIPSYELKPFMDGFFNPLSRKEKQLVDMLRPIKGRFYLMATSKRGKYSQGTVEHETTHAIYSFEKTYKEKVLSYLKGKDLQELKNFLIKKGYAFKDKIMLDEVNAYLCNDLLWLRKKGLKGTQYNKYSRELLKIRKPFWN